jgi:CRISPR-associated exonuclease Cas4
MIIAALLLLLVTLVLFWFAARKQKDAGLPLGRVIYADPGGWVKVEKPLYDSLYGLTGKPDYLVNSGGTIIPVEVKSIFAPTVPYDSHLFQLAAYCLLVERSMGKRPPHGFIKYRNRTIEVDYNSELENSLLDVIKNIRLSERAEEVDRSHEEANRCARCGFRSICDQRL